MKDLNNISHIYFLGIGGIGMSALARYAKAIGKNVAGYDLTRTPLTIQLEEEGIAVHYNEEINQFLTIYSKHDTLVVRTPAVPESNKEYQFLRENNYQIVKRSELLGFLTNDKVCIAVAGTHGKTSVSTMTTYLMRECGETIGAFLGGISRNFNSNLVLPEKENKVVVTEADEYDRSFLYLHPTIALITSMDADHLDIYGTHRELKKTFGEFAKNIVDGGKLLVKKGLNVETSKNVQKYSYSIEEDANFCFKNIQIINHEYVFDFCIPGETLLNAKVAYPGRINLENMLAAAAAAILAGVSAEKVVRAMPGFKGVVRRFDIQFKNEQIVYIDDYAHHPTELEHTITSVRELYANKKIVGVFQPHLYSRTQDFVDGFARSLDLLDEAILLDIYPAREEAIPGVTTELILNKMKLTNKVLMHKEEVLAEIKNRDFDVLLTMGAGNIDTLVQPLKNAFLQKYQKQ